LKLLFSNIIGSSGVDLLILHGFLGMGDNWKTHAKSLVKIGYKVHLLDQRNHGRSFWDDTFNYSLMAEDIVNYCKYYNLKKVLALGHSMGGKILMHLACNYPEFIKAFVVADIAPKSYKASHQNILNGLSNLDFSKIKSRLLADQELSKYVQDSITRQFLLKNLYWASPGKLSLRINIDVLKYKNEIIGEGLKPDLYSTHKCLFIKGGNSDYILDRDQSLIKKHFPNAEQILIPGVGHWLHTENPKIFFEIISQWLGKLYKF
tara:strand:+ start:723 stop:1508 length:786 start_codon:yes stop_codon:yes gene_type:complete